MGKIITMEMNSHLTAISRKALPVPVRWLLAQGMIHGHVLDYGCGKCAEINATVLNTAPGVGSVTSYDPYYEPDAINLSNKLQWDVILCTYVLCTLPEKKETSILRTIQTLLAPNGVAYVSVRCDKPRGGYGKNTKGTFQREVIMPFLYELRKTSQYRIYLLTKKQWLRTS